MSKSKKKFVKVAKAAKAHEENDLPKNKVMMVFSENKFYNDLNNPHFLKGKEYEIEGAGSINRWLKRGGKIVAGKQEPIKHVVNKSEIDKKPNPVEEKIEEPTAFEAIDVEPIDSEIMSEDDMEQEDIL